MQGPVICVVYNRSRSLSRVIQHGRGSSITHVRGHELEIDLQQSTTLARPEWVSETMFPFESRYFTTPSGHRMHYVDEGDGEPIVFLHGNPSWSFEFRHLINGLRSDFRCVAPDHIGFGLSGRSQSSVDHHPDAHAKSFEALLEDLDLRDVTLYMSDWGGPIGLDFARRHPDRVKRIVIANTWSWPVNDDMHFRRFSFMMRSWVGQLLIRGVQLLRKQGCSEGGGRPVDLDA